MTAIKAKVKESVSGFFLPGLIFEEATDVEMGARVAAANYPEKGLGMWIVTLECDLEMLIERPACLTEIRLNDWQSAGLCDELP